MRPSSMRMLAQPGLGAPNLLPNSFTMPVPLPLPRESLRISDATACYEIHESMYITGLVLHRHNPGQAIADDGQGHGRAAGLPPLSVELQ